LDGWLGLILAYPRAWRLGFVIVSSLAMVAVIFPAVDYIYLEQFFSTETVILPSLISAAAMLLMYVAGYWLMVGWRGDVPTSRRAILLYVLLGLVMIAVAIALIVYGLTTAGVPETF
jgi:hypothetical protein